MPTAKQKKYAPTAWGGEVFTDLTVPSGQVCQVRRMSITAMLKQGLVDDLQFLTGMVQEKHVSRVVGGRGTPVSESADNIEVSEEALKEVLGNTEKITQLENMLDRITLKVVVQPEILPLPEEGEARLPGAVYVDQVELEDKMFIFNFAVGGSRDVETFREQSEAVVERLADEPDVAREAIEPAGS